MDEFQKQIQSIKAQVVRRWFVFPPIIIKIYNSYIDVERLEINFNNYGQPYNLDKLHLAKYNVEYKVNIIYLKVISTLNQC